MRGHLRLEAGNQLPDLRAAPLSRTTLALYCGASGDHHPLHVDTDWVRDNTDLPDVIGHGMLTMAYLGRQLCQTFEPSEIKYLSTRFIAPTEIRDEIICRSVIQSVEEAVEGLSVRISLVAETARGKRVATGIAEVCVAT